MFSLYIGCLYPEPNFANDDPDSNFDIAESQNP